MPVTAAQITQAAAVAVAMPESDRERALAFRDYLDGECRNIRAWEQWVFWDRKNWQADDMGIVITQKAMDFAADLLEQARALPQGAAQNLAILHASKASGRNTINNMVELMRSLEGISVRPTDFDSDPMLLGVQNGCVDLKTGQFREAQKEDMLLKRANCVYDEKARCPMWEEFLEQVLPDKETRAFLRRGIGYALTGKTTEQVLFFFFGMGQNGKSTFIETVEKLLGDYTWRTSADLFLETRISDNKMNMLAALPEKRFVVGAEMPEEGRLAENRVKDLTGGDTINARKLYCEPFNYKPTHKIFFYGNHRPAVRGTDQGIWRRLLLIPFEVEIPPDKRDRKIVARLWAEAPGILNWAIAGCLEWQKDGLNPPESVRAAVADYRDEEDVVLQAVESLFDFRPELEVSRSRTSYAVEEWMKAAGYKFTMSPRAVSDRIKRLPGVRTRRTKTVRFWTGIGLKDAASVVGGPK